MEGLRLTGLVVWTFLLVKVAWTSREDPFPFVTGDFSDCEFPLLGCLPDWEQVGASCFKVTDIPLTWADAQTLCRRDHANLVIVRDTQEARQAGELLSRWELREDDWEQPGEPFWIGLQIKGQGYNIEYGNVSFVQGSTVSVISGPWREGQPDNSGGKYCAVSSARAPYSRAMVNCLDTRYAICERPATQPGDIPCAVDGDVIPRSHVCNGDLNCPDGSDELCESSCRFRPHISESPVRYSQVQARAEHCEWVLDVHPTRSISITIKDFKSGDPRKLLDIFCDQGGEDVLVGTVADESGDEVTYRCDSMRARVQFVHDGTQPRVDDFYIDWEEVPRLSGTVEAGPEPELYSIGLSPDPVYNLYFYKLYVAPDNTPITFKFLIIDPNPGEMLRLLDGPSQTDNLLLTLERGSREDVIDYVIVTSTGPHVLLIHDTHFTNPSGVIVFEYYTGCVVEVEAEAAVIIRSPGFPAHVRRPPLCTYQVQVPEGKIYLSWSIATHYPQLTPSDRLDIFVGDSEEPEYSGHGEWNNKYDTEDEQGITLRLRSSQAYSSKGFEAVFSIGCEVEIEDDANYQVYPHDREHLPPGEELRLSPAYGYYFNQEELNECSNDRELVTVKCEIGGRWSRQIPPKASPRHCRPPIQPRSAYVYALTGTFVDDEVTYVCYPGFHLVGQHTATCSPDAYWVGVPQCPPVSCLPLIAPAHGRIEYESTYPGDKTYASVATVVCDVGYEVVGTKQAFCTRYGTWDIKLPLPVCTLVDCGLPPAWPRFVALWPRPDGSRPPDFSPQPELDPPPQTTVNSRFWFSCRLGYIPKGRPSKEVKCGPDAEWLVGDLECVETVCPKSLIWKPPFVYQWPADRDVFYYGDVVTYLCHPNYQVADGPWKRKLHARLECGTYGTWSTYVPTCIPARCRVPGLLDVRVAPTGWSHVANSLVPHGTVVTFRCGQQVRNRVCKADIDNDQFNLIGDSYDCGVVDCWRVPPIPGLVPPPGATTAGSTFTFTCLDGQLPSGSSGRGSRTVTCLPNGNWDLGNLRCQRNLCPDPGRPADGLQHSTSYAEGAEVTFSCNKPGFTARPAAIKCIWNSITSTMVWNVSIPSPPVCEDKQKPAFPGCPLGPEEVQKYDILQADWIPDNGYYDNHVIQITVISRNPGAPIEDDVTITLRAIDYSNNVGQCYWQITVRDETPPVISSCPAEIIINTPLDHVGPVTSFPIPVDEYDDADSPFQPLPPDGEPRFELPEVEAPPESSHHVVILEFSATDDSDNEAKCDVPITVVGHTCNRYSTLPGRLQPVCYIVGLNMKTCDLQCPQEEGRSIVFYGTDSAIYSLTCEASGDENQDGAWQEDKEFPDCVEVKLAEVREQSPDETSPIVLMVQGLDLEVTLGPCQPAAIQEVIEDIAAGIMEAARDDDSGIRNCDIDVDTELSDFQLPAGKVSVSIRFMITRSQLSVAVDDLEGCKNRVTTALETSPFSSLNIPRCNAGPAVVTGEVSLQGDGMIDCELGFVTRPPGQCEECPLGHFYREDQCRECPPGTFQDERGAFGCKPCAPNTHSNRPASRSQAECRPLCPAGTVGDEDHLPPCRRCPPNTYWVPNQCLPCLSGSVTNPNVLNIGPGSCKPLCPMGTYSITGYADTMPCKPCPKGFSQNQVGQKACIPCPASTQTTLAEASTDPGLECISLGDPALICPGCDDGCVIENNAVRCQCAQGRTGMFCEIMINPCAPQRLPCHNGGTCTPNELDPRGYTCGCVAPFTGNNCEIDGTIACNGLQCGAQHEGCRDEDSGYTCLCPHHLTGTGSSCGTLVDLCETNPCGPGGACSTTVGGFYYVCSCRPGYTGPDCQTELNECDPSPCYNGGTCVDLVDGWRCACPSNFVGDRCETLANNLCTPGKCGGPTQGQCEMDYTTGMAFCQCYPGYTEYSSRCFPSPCVGQAPCELSEDSETGFECDCPPGRLGHRCQIQCRPLEINFLIDVSRAIQPSQYDEQKDFIKALVKDLDPHSGGYRAIQFGNTATGTTSSKPEPFEDIVEGLELPTLRLPREISSALEDAREGFDDSYTQILILPLYGPTGMLLDDLEEEWGRIRDSVGTVGKIYPVVLVIGPAVLEQEVAIMKETYEDTAIYRINSMDDAEDVMEELLHQLCTIHAVNPCEMQPCRNGGTCVHDPRADVEDEDDYYCRCRQGFTGKDCQIDVLDQCLSPCHTNPCQRGGTCLDSTTCSYGGLNGYDYCDELQNGFYCMCEDSSGVLCDVPHYTCPDDYEECCGPEFPYIGEDCEIGLPRRCSMWHCRHGGTCHVVTNLGGAEEVTCICPPGFTGDRCEEIVDRCEDNQCEHDSECVSVSNNYYCICSESTYGDRCELERDLCEFEDKVCLNGGACELSEEGEPTCDCSQSDNTAWIGDYCECDMWGPCHPGRPCLHGGTCSDDVCHCLSGYTGTFCQYYVSECELRNYETPPICHNDGEWDEDTCRCNCPCPWGGWDCSKRAVPYFLEVSGFAVIQLIQTFNLPKVHTVSIYVRSTSFHPSRTVLKLYTKETPEYYNDDRTLVYTLTTTDLIVNGIGPIRFRSNVFTNKELHRFVIVWDPEDKGGVTLYIDGLESGFLSITSTIGAPELQEYGFITMGEPALNQPPFEGTLAGLLVADGAFSGYDTQPSVVPDYKCLLPFYPDLDLWGHVTWTELSTACVLPNYCPPRLIGRPPLPLSLCPHDVYVWNSERECVSSPTWEEPELRILPTDIYPYVSTCSTMQSGGHRLAGKYEVSVGILDTASDTSRVCTFNVLIPRDGECGLPPAPLHGTPPACFRVSGILTCRLGCPYGLALIRGTSDLVTCHVDGTWRFADDVILDPRDPILVPPCGAMRDPEVTVRIGVTYRLDSWVGPVEDSVRNKLLSAVRQINANYRLCQAECDAEVDIENRQPATIRATVTISRIKYYGEVPVYYGGISDTQYPVDDLARAIVDNNAFGLDSIQTGFDISGVLQLSWKEELSCPKLHQLVRDKCVECPAGTYYLERSSRCEFCPIGQYIDQAGQVQCKSCGPGLTTAQVGTPSFQGCTGFCLPGELFNLESRRCEHCPKGFYQPYSNYTYCFCCPPTFTSQPGAANSNSCYEACPPGTFSNSTFYGACRPCPPDTYSSQPGSEECTPCPVHYRTEGEGHASGQACKDLCYMKPDYCPYNTTCVWDPELEEAICQCNSPSCKPPKPSVEVPIDPGPTVIALVVGGVAILLVLFCFGIWVCLRRRSRVINEKEDCPSVITTSTANYYPVGIDTIVKRWKPNHPTVLTSPSVNIMGMACPDYSTSNCGCGTQSYSTYQHLQTQPTVTQTPYSPQSTDHTPLAVQVRQEPARMVLGTAHAQSTAHVPLGGETGAVHIDYSNNGMAAVTNNGYGGMSFGEED